MSVALRIDPAIQFSRVERLALEALALPGAEGRASFDAWLERVDIDALTPWMVRLVPPLYLRHAEGDPSVPHAARLRGITRFWYTRNEIQMSAAESAIRALRDAGIAVVIFKGLSASLCVHERTAARPMMDIDILVPRADFGRADAILQRVGWAHRYLPEQRMMAEHSIDYVHSNGCALDLHVRPLLEIRDGLLEPEIFSRGRRMEWRGCSVIVPCLDDEALIALVGAVRERARARLDWVSDMARMLDRPEGLDWAAMWQRARRFGVVHQLCDAMLVLGSIRGLERVRQTLGSLLAGSPDVERACVQRALDTCRTYGLPDSISGTPERESHCGVSAMRIVNDDRDAVVGIHLRRKHIDLVPAVLRITDMARWRDCARNVLRRGEGLIEVPPGLVTLRDPCMPEGAHAAQISVRSAVPDRLRASERVPIELTVTNASPHPWPLPGSSQLPLGISWHVFGTDGTTVNWDMPRLYLDTPAASACNVAYLEPGGRMNGTIPFVAPAAPGRYIMQLDMVHERVCWFSAQGSTFPSWELEVLP
jgi:hypothetical protein